MRMLKPALAIFSMVASCKLPFGKPNLSFALLLILPLPSSGPGHCPRSSPDCLPSRDGDTSLSQRGHGLGIHPPFGELYALVQAFRAVAGHYRHGFLENDRAAV